VLAQDAERPQAVVGEREGRGAVAEHRRPAARRPPERLERVPKVAGELGGGLPIEQLVRVAVARELVPIMQLQGREAEEAAVGLGAGGWTIFFRVTLPSIRWGLLYGVILCNARAMGEFGAVAVVSGHIRGLTTTMPLQAQVLYDEYDLVGAFAVASLLMSLALLTLLIKTAVEAFGARRRRSRARHA